MVLPFLRKRSKIIEIVAARDIVFALAQSGVCAAFSRGIDCLSTVSSDLWFSLHQKVEWKGCNVFLCFWQRPTKGYAFWMSLLMKLYEACFIIKTMIHSLQFQFMPQTISVPWNAEAQGLSMWIFLHMPLPLIPLPLTSPTFQNYVGKTKRK